MITVTLSEILKVSQFVLIEKEDSNRQLVLETKVEGEYLKFITDGVVYSTFYQRAVSVDSEGKVTLPLRKQDEEWAKHMNVYFLAAKPITLDRIFSR